MISTNLSMEAQMAEERNTYDAEVREVFSGDDLVVLVDLGVESLWKRQRVRLAGGDTPNAISAGGRRHDHD